MKTRRYNTRSTSRKENHSYPPIPFDHVIEILTRLPAKSLARFRCLSKLYASTLCTQNFIDSFLISSRPKLLFTVVKGCKTLFFSSSSPQPHQNPSSTVTIDFHMSFSSNCPSVTFRPVNGLVCGLNQRKLKGSKVTIPFICNPSTGQFLNLPRVKTRRRRLVSFFGYDPVEKQYKVLCMTSFSQEHQVLTIETGKKKKPSWRRIKCDIRHYPICVESRGSHCVYDGICINGVFYYLAYVNNGFPEIVCFDVRLEKFSIIKRPHEGMNHIKGTNLEPTLLNYKGKLAKFQPKKDFNQLIYIGIQLWVLEDAEKQEWSSHLYVLPHMWKDIVAETKLCFVGTISTGEIVLSLDNMSNFFYLLYYNPETNNITKVEIQRMEAFQSHKAYTFFDHVENVKLMENI